MPALDFALCLWVARCAADMRDAVLAAQAIEHNADFLLGRILFARCSANVPHKPFGRRLRAFGFLAHLYSLTVTMSQKSSFTQPSCFVSQALTPNNREQSISTGI